MGDEFELETLQHHLFSFSVKASEKTVNQKNRWKTSSEDLRRGKKGTHSSIPSNENCDKTESNTRPYCNVSETSSFQSIRELIKRRAGGSS